MTACGLMFSHTQRVYKMCKGLPPAWALNYVILRLRKKGGRGKSLRGSS